MSEQVKNTFLSVGVGIVIGVGLLIGMGAVVTSALTPLNGKLDVIAQQQSRTDKAVQDHMAAMEQKIEGLRQLAAEPRPQAPQAPQGPQQPQEDLSKVYDIPVGDSYIQGKADAPITIVEFSDLQCPFCSRFHEPIQETLKAYPGKVKLVFKNFPLQFHPNARPAAKAAFAAGLQGKYYEMIGELLKNQTALSDEKYKELAGQLKLNVPKFLKDLQDNSAAWDKRLDAEMELGSKVDVRGTPTYFLNGKKTTARSVEQWKAEIDALLKK